MQINVNSRTAIPHNTPTVGPTITGKKILSSEFSVVVLVLLNTVVSLVNCILQSGLRQITNPDWIRNIAKPLLFTCFAITSFIVIL